ncbi:MAG: hypothetical protein ACYCSP_15045 [Acidobacteriaceae bacterium]
MLHDRPVDESKTAIQCSNVHWEIGTRIHAVVTPQTQTRVYLATDITVYTVEIQQDFGAVGGNHEWTGGALLVEAPQVSKTTDGWTGTLWLDGFPAQITPDTKLLTAPPGTRLGYGSSTLWGGIWTTTILARSSTPPFSGALFKPNTWVFYRGVGGVDGRLRLYYLRMWPNVPNSAFTKYQSQIESRVRIQYGQGNNEAVFIHQSSRHRQQLAILTDTNIQKFVRTLGMSVIPQFQVLLPQLDPARIKLHFYAVRGTGMPLDSGMKGLAGPTFLQRPSWDEAVVSLPNGLIVVPSRTLANAKCNAQLASLLSYAVTAILQQNDFRARPGIGRSADGAVVVMAQYQSTMRISIRQMYLAGYDIREAPYAWAVAQGKAVNNPVINSKNPDKEIPWYAAYAFNYISQYYKDVDYSKLKRGRAEYQQFLKDLYQADPSLPRPKAPN